jgi:hypothetical protein
MSTQKVKNTFTKGMNQDKSFLKSDNAQYLEGSNIRITTDDSGDSTGSVATIKGNKFSIAIPDVGRTWKLEATDTLIASLDGNFYDFDVTINNVTSNFSYNGSELDVFYKDLAAHISNGYPDDIKAQYTEEGVAVFSTSGADVYSLIFSNWNFSVSSPLNSSLLASAASNLQVIGTTNIRESAILFTTVQNPNGPGSDTGQIWELTWNEQEQPTLRLVRHAADKFNKEYDIEARGRFEAQSIQRVYWTDDNNPVRTINIMSDSAYLDEIDIAPRARFDIPIVQELSQQGGDLPTGWYIYGYRLKTLGGDETNFSPFSQPFPINEMNELSEKYLDYEGGEEGVPTTKSLTVKIGNIDPNYSNIDIVVGYMKTLTSQVEYSFVEENGQLTGAPEYEFTHSELEPELFISDAEIEIPNTTFSRCKTLTIKDNTLILGNIKEDNVDISDYDARAVRYKANDNSGNVPFWENTTNKRNPYNDLLTREPASDDQYKHQEGSSILGATGENISYSFLTRNITLDNYTWGSLNAAATTGAGIGLVSEVAQPGSPINNDPKIKLTTMAQDTTLNGRDIPLGGGAIWDNFKNPFIASHFRGYMRSEIYRFGIVFYGIDGRALEVKWIDDIKMPEHYEVPSFELTPSGSLIGKTLGLAFNVEVPDNIKPLVSGFSIVRAHRGKKDETIVGQGLMFDLSYKNIARDDKGSGPTPLEAFYYKAPRIGPTVAGSNIQGYFGYDYAGGGGPKFESLFLEYHDIQVPELLMNDVKGKNLAGYKVRPIAGVTPYAKGVVNSDWKMDDADTATFCWTKFYDIKSGDYFSEFGTGDSIDKLSFDIEESFFVEEMHSINNPVGVLEDSFYTNGAFGVEGFLNYAGPWGNKREYTKGTAQQRFRSRGGYTHSIRVDGAGCKRAYVSTPNQLGFTTSPDVNSRVTNSTYYNEPGSNTQVIANSSVGIQFEAEKHLLFNLYNPTPNQYGGFKIGDIENTEYISTGHYQPVSIKDGITSYTCEVYGGDTYINIYDEAICRSGDNSSGTPFENFFFESDGESDGVGIFVPIESTINLDLRRGVHVANSGYSNYDSENLVNFRDNVDSLYLPTGGVPEWFNRQADYRKFRTLSSFSFETNEWDNRVWSSQTKTNGEPITIF